jgi:alpha-1,6-mannosyltransferase
MTRLHRRFLAPLSARMETPLALRWVVLLLVLLGFSALSAGLSGWFEAAIELIDRPVLPFTALMVAAGLAALALVPLIRQTVTSGRGDLAGLIWLMVATGLLMRLVLLASTPILETDYYRYLWDGGVAAAGYNPYAVSPDDAQGEPYHYTLQKLAQASGTVIEGVNHPELKTIYPPVAEAAFALAHKLSPWSLTSWRVICLAAELATLALLLTLLREIGRPAVWASLYWLNPLIAKEMINSAHMDSLVPPFVLLALLLSARGRLIPAAVAIGLAIGAKIWPLILVPLIFRRWFDDWRRLVVPGLVLGALCVLFAAPMIAGGLDQSSGLTAYATHWRNSSGLYVILQNGLSVLASPFDIARETIGVAIRIILAGSAFVAMVWVVWKPIETTADLLQRAALLTLALLLLVPSQFPWYASWALPLAAFRPTLGLLVMTALMPIYYSGFYFSERDLYQTYRDGIVFLIWVPVWAVLGYEVWRSRNGMQPLVDAADQRHA